MAKRNKAVSADSVLSVETAKPRIMIPSGITLLEGLRTTEDLLGNRYLASRVTAARQAVMQRHRVLNLMTHVDPARRPDLDHAAQSAHD